MSTESRIRFVNQQFLEKGINIDFEWLSGCVGFFLDEEPSIDDRQLLQQAEEQWELSNLSDSGTKCLPNLIFAEKKPVTINGRFAVQMELIIDISESAYEQLQKLENKTVDVGKEQPEFKQNNQKTKKKRVIKMELTDGHRTVTAMEYKPIPFLTTKLPPGTKMLLVGPMRCVNHVLFLEAKNISILGGEVEALLVSNAFENVLLRKLNRPINPNPRNDYDETQAAPALEVPRPVVTHNRNANPQPNNVVSSTTDLDAMGDDDLFCDIDIDQITMSVVQPPRRIEPQPSEQNIAAPPQGAEPQQSSITTTHNITNNSTSLTICDDNYPHKIRGINLVSIKQLSERSATELNQRKHFLVKASIDSIIQPGARVSRGKWILGIVIEDAISRNKLRVQFDSPVVEKLSGVSAQEVCMIKKRSNEQPQYSDDLENILNTLAIKLQDLNSFLKLEYSSEMKYPSVIEIIASAPVLEQIFRKLADQLKS